MGMAEDLPISDVKSVEIEGFWIGKWLHFYVKGMPGGGIWVIRGHMGPGFFSVKLTW